ncbi:MAG: NAD-dependent epimerase/dehydratase family protein [Nanoarchaeota archaeon]|nr:NAD-dependent epimerase/dehydratase family protein [Nanoarchaeota archaeon]
MKIVVTGGAGFIGSHVAESYARQGHEVVVVDNLARAALLKRKISEDQNWSYLSKIKGIQLLRKDVRDPKVMENAAKGADVILHAAAQTAVTTSLVDPATDFSSNAIGTFNTLEAARKADVKAVLYCSTNKVYGDNVNSVGVKEGKQRYTFEKNFEKGIPESFSIDHCEHTPYGCSKLTGDLYMQDFGRIYGLRTGVFRMSCIYGTRQFGVEDQGWLAWFAIATILKKPITLYGDGKQVRDVLFIDDLIALYDKFVKSKVKHGVWNIGGGPKFTLSLLELLDHLKGITGKQSPLSYSDWRASDQKVYVSDIRKAMDTFGWAPKIAPEEGIRRLVAWIQENKARLG